MLRGLSLMLGTRHGLVVFVGTALATFGLLAGLVQLYAALWPKNQLNQTVAVVVIICVMVTAACYRAWPRRSLRREFGLPDISITVKVGDLFEQSGNLVIGFSDTFDTDTTDGTIISSTSVQGQFLERVYSGDRARLDNEIDLALGGVASIDAEDPAAKAGKVKRYPIGTVVTLGLPARRYFCVAYSYMQNSLVVRSSVDYLWTSLNCVWDAVRLFGQRNTLVIPVIGSELARISSLDRESLLKMIILSFVARSRQEEVCKELVVVVHQRDYEKINMLEVKAFLSAL
jgi:hypothetical protein